MEQTKINRIVERWTEDNVYGSAMWAVLDFVDYIYRHGFVIQSILMNDDEHMQKEKFGL